MASPQAVPLWEKSKENVQPAKRGRTIDAIEQAFGNRSAFNADRLRQRAEFEDSISGFTGAERASEEAFAVWKRYIEWATDAYPSSSSPLLDILERATQVFMDTRANDVAYVSLWIRYAELVPDPADVFAFLATKKIGENVALFWMAWAWTAENVSNWALADKIYRMGIAKHAAPTDRLTTRYKEFQRRAYKAWVQSTAPAGEVVKVGRTDYDAVKLDVLTAKMCPSAALTAAAAENERPTLAHISEDSAMRSHRPGLSVMEAVAVAQDAASHFPRRNGSAQVPGAAGLAPRPEPQQQPLQIFTDEQFEPARGAHDALPLPIGAIPGVDSAVEWKGLGGRGERRKENDGPLSAWAGTIVPAHAGVAAAPPANSRATNGNGSAPPGGMGFAVFEDSLPALSSPAPQPSMPLPVSHDRPPLLSTGAATITSADCNASRPVTAAAAGVASPKVAARLIPSVSAASPDAKGMLVPEGLSFEEQRARHWFAEHPDALAPVQQAAVAALANDTDMMEDTEASMLLSPIGRNETARLSCVQQFLQELDETQVQPASDTTENDNIVACHRLGGVGRAPSGARALAPLDPVVASRPQPQPQPQRTLFKSVARNGRASIAPIDEDASFVASPDRHDDVTIHTRMAADEVSDLFMSPTVGRALSGRSQPGTTAAATATAAATRTKEGYLGSTDGGVMAKLPPYARRLSMHLLGGTTATALQPAARQHPTTQPVAAAVSVYHENANDRDAMRSSSSSSFEIYADPENEGNGAVVTSRARFMQ